MGAHGDNIWAVSWVIRMRQSCEYLEEDNSRGGEGVGKPTTGTDWWFTNLEEGQWDLRAMMKGRVRRDELLVRYGAKLWKTLAGQCEQYRGSYDPICFFRSSLATKWRGTR